MTHILIVEDNALFRRSLREALSTRFPLLAIDEATNSKEALQKVDALAPDLVFMDIKLPGVSGLELTERIKSLHDEITIIMLTSYDMPEYREAAHKSGANYFFTKGNTRSSDILDLVEQITAYGGARHQLS